MNEYRNYRPDGVWSLLIEVAARLEARARGWYALDRREREAVNAELEQLATRLELLGQREADLSRLLRGIAGCFEVDEIEIEDEEEAPYADEKPMSSAND